MKKRLLNLLVPLLIASSASAADERHSLIISFHEGDSIAIVLADKPCATLIDDSVRIEAPSFGATYMRSAIAHFHFGWYDPDDARINALPENMVRIVYTDNNTVRLYGINNASYIAMYGLDGRRISTMLTSLTDGIAIDLTAYPAGTYLISINNQQTFKIIKQ